MFKKILIANRGEIAVRIIRTCREMGIRTVSIFSDADRTSPHVLKSHEAYCVGPPPSNLSYLNTKEIINIIKKNNIDAVHPGYGFLSENAQFSDTISKQGITWIGPNSIVIKTMGDKMAARKLAQNSGVPVVPGTTKPLESAEQAKKTAKKIGYPILIKAAGGGGGKGMRIIYSDADLEQAMERASSEAEKAFADNRIYIEKYLEDPHHIEIQIFADNHGNIVSLGERECSIQRRYQKIIEETPSPFIDEGLRKILSKSAIKIAKACQYSGAGTIEFLVDKYYNYYFLEMNTRLQVEHPITEMVTGIDLVKEQILIASGKKLTFSQKDIQQSGHAMECRIYAEDGLNDFSPSTGKIQEMIVPQGLGVRFDDGVRMGQEITPYYDPLLGKLITWGDDRTIALSRMQRALNEFHISGIKSTISICMKILEYKNFQKGKYSTHFLDSIKEDIMKKSSTPNKPYDFAARIGAIEQHRRIKTITASFVKRSKMNKWVRQGRMDVLK
tara:strand:+ start:1046 stop:2548 length:1503 start_codon:yes stop_codon:yes gene_type:complete